MSELTLTPTDVVRTPNGPGLLRGSQPREQEPHKMWMLGGTISELEINIGPALVGEEPVAGYICAFVRLDAVGRVRAS
jgi:hypothetical protein